MTLITLVTILAVAILIAIVVIGLLVVFAMRLHTTRTRKVAQLAAAHRQLLAVTDERDQLTAEVGRLRDRRPTPQASPVIGDRRRGPDATVQFAAATAPVVGRPPAIRRGASS